ncbi:unnamed protein product [Durusdinium trenchii]|uniref:Uncharacterized protein n=1 Tax=Durusdinium trenchii TaxID=1381693 RepID=A0ABP0RRJ6_9DINO
MAEQEEDQQKDVENGEDQNVDLRARLTDGKRYISSGGAGCLVWGLTFLLMGTQALAPAPPEDNAGQIEFGKFDRNRLTKLFGERPSFRRLECVLVLARAVANLTVLIYSAWRLPPRNPSIDWNLSKYCLAWLEVPVAMLFGLSTISALLRSLPPNTADRNQKLRMFSQFVYVTGRFSALSGLPYASPMKILKEVQLHHNRFLHEVALEKHQEDNCASRVSTSTEAISKMLTPWHYVKLFFRIVGFCFTSLILLVTAAIGAVLVKLSQVAFVTSRPWSQWTFYEYVQIAAFINALAGLGIDINLVGQQKVVQERYSDRIGHHVRQHREQALHNWWKDALLESLLDFHSWRFTLVVATTLSLDDCIKLKGADEAPEASGNTPTSSPLPRPEVKGKSRSYYGKDTE